MPKNTLDLSVRREQLADPRSLAVGDLVRFVSLPHEWSRPGIGVHADSIAFMKVMIRRTSPSRIVEKDSFGYPWIRARIRKRGKTHYHGWLITEQTGWRRVKRRA